MKEVNCHAKNIMLLRRIKIGLNFNEIVPQTSIKSYNLIVRECNLIKLDIFGVAVMVLREYRGPRHPIFYDLSC